MSGEPETMTIFVLTTPIQRAFICAGNARKTLESGVTTVRDVGGSERIAIQLRDAIVAGQAIGPTIVPAGHPITMTGGHGVFVGREADGEDVVRKAVREQRNDGAACVKFIATGGVLTKGAVPGTSQLLEAELRAGIDEAHRHGMRTAAHAIGADGIKNALRAGIDSMDPMDRIVEAGADAGMPAFVIEKARAIATVAAAIHWP